MQKYVNKTEAYTSALVSKLKITTQHHGQILQFFCPGEQMNIDFVYVSYYCTFSFLLPQKNGIFFWVAFLLKEVLFFWLFVAVVK